jgi:hypothetical protein
MNPPPAIPEEARRHYVVGKTLSDGAKKAEDFTDAIVEYKSALLAAPWWPEAKRDYALTLEAAERFRRSHCLREAVHGPESGRRAYSSRPG